MSSLHGSIPDMLPPWWRPPKKTRDVIVDGQVSDDEADGDQQVLKPLFPRCVPVPGLLHICHNLEMDMDKSMHHFRRWYATMSIFSTLLCHAGWCKVLYSSCIEDTFWSQCEVMQNQLLGKIPAPYEKRWGHIYSFLGAALPILKILRSAWNEHRYIMMASGSSETNVAEFDPAQMTRALQDVTGASPSPLVRIERPPLTLTLSHSNTGVRVCKHLSDLTP